METYFAFQWHITDNCDQRCKHCYIFSENSRLPTVEMAFANMQKVMDNCEEMCGRFDRIPYFYLTGAIRFCIRIFGNCWNY
ncbi:MAG: hypothetical protein LBF83_03695 [Spirochaetaceae bacterium]|nr:hypothetical protein [Spirochaetaceae bacterium]